MLHGSRSWEIQGEGPGKVCFILKLTSYHLTVCFNDLFFLYEVGERKKTSFLVASC
jgi:hypothetical protein